jgi:hypothetical protein
MWSRSAAGHGGAAAATRLPDSELPSKAPGCSPPLKAFRARGTYHNGEAAPTRAALRRRNMRHLPDFAAIRDLRRRPGASAKIHDKHLAAAEVHVDRLVDAGGGKDCCRIV